MWFYSSGRVEEQEGHSAASLRSFCLPASGSGHSAVSGCKQQEVRTRQTNTAAGSVHGGGDVKAEGQT